MFSFHHDMSAFLHCSSQCPSVSSLVTPIPKQLGIPKHLEWFGREVWEWHLKYASLYWGLIWYGGLLFTCLDFFGHQCFPTKSQTTSNQSEAYHKDFFNIQSLAGTVFHLRKIKTLRSLHSCWGIQLNDFLDLLKTCVWQDIQLSYPTLIVPHLFLR